MSEPVGRYLRQGPEQRRLVAAMTSGHARAKHGPELSHPGARAYSARVRHHLRVAPIAVAVADPGGRSRLLLADPRTNQIAWITPHREHRSTFFQPRGGVENYLRVQRAISAPGRWRPLDAAALRRPARSLGRSARQIGSADRGGGGSTGRSMG